MYVLDSSIFASIIVKDDYYEIATNFVKKHFRDENITIELAFIEVANALWKHTFTLKRISEEKYHILRDSLKSLVDNVAQVYNSLEILEEALDNAIKFGVTVYDALYLTLALNKGCKLVTLDHKLIKTLSEKGLENMISMP